MSKEMWDKGNKKEEKLKMKRDNLSWWSRYDVWLKMRKGRIGRNKNVRNEYK